MEKKRKIELVARKVSFAEAEEEDNSYWKNKTAEERLNELISLRYMVFGNLNESTIQKFVRKRSVYEEDD